MSSCCSIRSHPYDLIDEDRCRGGEQTAVEGANGAGIRSFFCLVITSMCKKHSFVYAAPVQNVLTETLQTGHQSFPGFLKKNQNAPRPSEHPPVMGEKCQNVEVGSKAANTKPLHGILTGSPMKITLGQQYDVGEKPSVILYIYINRHVGTPETH